MPWSQISWIIYSVTFVIVLLGNIITWLGYLWSKKMTKRIDEGPYHFSQSYITRVAHYINKGLFIRILFWFVTSGLMLSVAMIGIEECKNCLAGNNSSRNSTGNETNESHFLSPCNFTANDTNSPTDKISCRNPWYYTFNAALAMTTTSVFLKIHYLLKLGVHLTATVLFCNAILNWEFEVFSKGTLNITDWSQYVGSVYGHCYFLIVLVVFLHFLDRQVEYVCRLDFIWKKKLRQEKEEASSMGMVNKMLLMNILPLHVANQYINGDISTEGNLYYEEYEHAAVMFASIPEYTDFYTENMVNEQGRRCLQVLNEIICDFDELLYVPSFSKVEKIKTIGSTYMAATGLLPGRGSQNTKDKEDPERNVITLVNFGKAMMDKLAQLNRDTQQDFRLRIGISIGPLIAGVVGMSKPQYDIWGDTVNTASRMDSTGVIGRIHVTKEVAEILMSIENKAFRCECRGEIYVKGKGKLTTYMVHTPYDKPHVEITRL